jgi:hypothetical protein
VAPVPAANGFFSFEERGEQKAIDYVKSKTAVSPENGGLGTNLTGV